MASEHFPLLPPDYVTSSPLKFALVMMLIFLNVSWKRFFLKRHMTFSSIIFVFVFFPFLDVYAINFPICTVVWQPLKMTFFAPWQLHVDCSLLLLDVLQLDFWLQFWFLFLLQLDFSCQLLFSFICSKYVYYPWLPCMGLNLLLVHFPFGY